MLKNADHSAVSSHFLLSGFPTFFRFGALSIRLSHYLHPSLMIGFGSSVVLGLFELKLSAHTHVRIKPSL
jgi:hypothetical protein